MLSHFQRKTRSNQNFSIELVFQTIRKKLKGKIALIKKECPYESNGFFKRIANIVFAFMNQGKINHITGDIHYIGIFLRKKHTIQTYHDLGFLNIKPGLKRWFLKKLWLEWPTKRCVVLTAVSDSTRNAILNEIIISPNKIRVIHNPIFEGFEYYPKPFNIKKPRILHFGTASNKNLFNLVNSLKGFNCELIIIGKNRPEIVDLLIESGLEYTYTWNLSNDEIIEQYKKCDIVSMVSTLEGFGLPIIEAQKTGRVIITSLHSCMPETAAAGACFVNPFEIESIREGFEKIVSDSHYREDLIEKGLENVKRFDPEVIAQEYLDLYEEVLNG